MKKHLYLVLDTETATIPNILGMGLSPEKKTKIGTALPIIYDLAYQIIDRQGTVYKTVSNIIADCYYDSRLFETAYYKAKRPIYESKILRGEIKVTTWNSAITELWQDAEKVDYASAFNAAFDYKKAICFTNRYFANRSNPWFEKELSAYIENIQTKKKKKSEGKSDFLDPMFNLPNGKSIPIVDIMPMSIKRLLGKRYTKFAYENGLITKSGKFFQTSAEAIYRYIKKDMTFVESHTALEDVKIETEMLLKCLKKGKPEVGLGTFCYRLLPSVAEYEKNIMKGGSNYDYKS